MNISEHSNNDNQERPENETLNALLDKLQKQGRDYRRARSLTSVFTILLCVESVLLLLSSIWWNMPSGTRHLLDTVCTIGAFCTFVFYIPVVILLHRFKSTRWQDTQWQQLETVAVVGPLLEALEIAEESVQPVIQNALTRLLPRLRQEDAKLLTRRQWDCLYGALYTSFITSPRVVPIRYMLVNLFDSAPFPNKSLVLAILKALEQIGNDESLAVVEKVAKNAVNIDIRAAALECLPFLQARVAIQAQEKVLLRASGSAYDMSDQLLHPADAAPQLPEEQLLRVSCVEEQK